MSADLMVEYDQIVCDLRESLRDTTSGLRYAPQLIRRVLETGAWRKRYDRATRSEVGFDTVDEFIGAKPTEGLGCTGDLIDRLVKDDADAVRMLREARKGTHNISTRARTTGHGDRRDYALERLEKAAPHLHAEVRAGTLSSNKAMIRAGLRGRKISVAIDRPDAVAASLRKHMSPDDLSELIRLLQESSHG